MSSIDPTEPVPARSTDSWSSLQDEFVLRNVQKFDCEQDFTTKGMIEIQLNDGPPPLYVPTKTRKVLFNIGLGIAVLDLGVMPIVYYYSLTFGAKLKEQTVFIIITCLFCMMTFAHYTHRCVRLIFKCSDRYGPIGWGRKWRWLEFTNINFAICASLFELALLIGTFPESPLIRICALPSTIICYYLGTLFLLTSTLTHLKIRLPFAMSSTPKGSLFQPALLAILEDSAAIEYRGELAARIALLKRYEASPLFRKMIRRLSWAWGGGFMGIAVVATLVIFGVEDERVAFGVGWGVPWIWAVVYSVGTVVFVKKSLRKERRVWKMGRGTAC